VTYIRLVGHRRAGVQPEEYAWPETLRALVQDT
jgi:hypothetical protein